MPGSSSTSTTLIVRNMEGSDAGTYQVKINSTEFYRSRNRGSNAPFCHSLFLPLLEPNAGFSPVTFTVQENQTPEYDFPSVVTHYVGNAGSLALGSDAQSESSARFNSSLLSRNWFRNGNRITNDDNLTGSSQDRHLLRITYSDSADITGDYVGTLWFDYRSLNMDLEDGCSGYYDYLDYYLNRATVRVSFWRISISSE